MNQFTLGEGRIWQIQHVLFCAGPQTWDKNVSIMIKPFWPHWSYFHWQGRGSACFSRSAIGLLVQKAVAHSEFFLMVYESRKTYLFCLHLLKKYLCVLALLMAIWWWEQHITYPKDLRYPTAMVSQAFCLSWLFTQAFSNNLFILWRVT